MNLHIVNGPAVPDWSAPRYRGPRRREPYYCNELPADSEINKLFVDWYIEEGGESGIVHDLAKAVHYAKLCTEHFRGRSFEVIESTEADALPDAGGRFLGYDLLYHSANSLLYWGLKTWSTKGRSPQEADTLWKGLSLALAPTLNEFGLFGELDEAVFCLQSMIALENFAPGYFQSGDLNEFNGMRIYLVWGQSAWPPVAGGEAHWQDGAKPPS